MFYVTLKVIRSSFILMVLCVIGIYSQWGNARFTLGPTKHLYFIGIPIDTYPKYVCCIIILFILIMIEVDREGYVQPWLYDNIYPRDDKKIPEMYKLEALAVSTLSVTNERIAIVIMVHSSLSKIDFIFFTLLFVSFFQALLFWICAKNKEFKELPKIRIFEYFKRKTDYNAIIMTIDGLTEPENNTIREEDEIFEIVENDATREKFILSEEILDE